MATSTSFDAFTLRCGDFFDATLCSDGACSEACVITYEFAY